MKILIIYGTSEGQTRKIARFMEEILQAHQHQVVIADVTEEPPSPDTFDAILIGSSIHAHKYNPAIEHYATEHVETLNNKPSAFFSVCLAVASDLEEEHREAHKIAEDFLSKVGWQTDDVAHIAGALRYTKYDYLKKLIMRMIAKKKGNDVDTSKDYEYTDWDAVKEFTLAFAESKMLA